MKGVPYSNGVDSIMYVMVCSRPDLAFAINSVCRYMANPGMSYWEKFKWILRYIRGSLKLGFMFKQQKEEDEPLMWHVDLDFVVQTPKSPLLV